MTTYEIKNDQGEVVETADSYIDALGVAAHLTKTTLIPHHVPVQMRVLDFAV